MNCDCNWNANNYPLPPLSNDRQPVTTDQGGSLYLPKCHHRPGGRSLDKDIRPPKKKSGAFGTKKGVGGIPG